MKKPSVAEWSVVELVERFAANRIEQDRAELAGSTALFRPLFDEMRAIQDELASRPGDQRRALAVLLDHPNQEVQLNAAKATVAILPELARATLQLLWSRGHYPQKAEAGMTINALDRGEWKPK